VPDCRQEVAEQRNVGVDVGKDIVGGDALGLFEERAQQRRAVLVSGDVGNVARADGGRRRANALVVAEDEDLNARLHPQPARQRIVLNRRGAALVCFGNAEQGEHAGGAM
jgi:hypothetical protein